MENCGRRNADAKLRIKNYESKIANGSPGMENRGCKVVNDSRGSVDGKLEMTVRASGRWVALTIGSLSNDDDAEDDA